MTRIDYIEKLEPLLEESISLSIEDKQRVRKGFSYLSFSQLQQLIQIFIEEKKKVEEFEEEYAKEIHKIRLKNVEQYRRGHEITEKEIQDLAYQQGFLFLKVSGDNDKNTGIEINDIISLNLNLDKIARLTTEKQKLKIYQIRAGSIEEILGGTINQIIVIGGLLFSVGKGILHLLKEGHVIKKISKENKILDIEIEEKEIQKRKENTKKKNIEKLLAKNDPSIIEVIKKIDEKYLDYILSNFEFNPFEEMNANQLNEAIKVAKLIEEEFGIEQLAIQIEEKSATNNA